MDPQPFPLSDSEAIDILRSHTGDRYADATFASREGPWGEQVIAVDYLNANGGERRDGWCVEEDRTIRPASTFELPRVVELLGLKRKPRGDGVYPRERARTQTTTA